MILQHSIGLERAGALEDARRPPTDAELRTEVQSCMGVLCYPIVAMAGADQRGSDVLARSSSTRSARRCRRTS